MRRRAARPPTAGISPLRGRTDGGGIFVIGFQVINGYIHRTERVVVKLAAVDFAVAALGPRQVGFAVVKDHPAVVQLVNSVQCGGMIFAVARFISR